MILSFANKDNFIYLFLIWMSFISFSCLIALARTSNIMLKTDGKSEHLCFVPDLRGKVFSFPPLIMMLVVGFSYRAFIY